MENYYGEVLLHTGINNGEQKAISTWNFQEFLLLSTPTFLHMFDICMTAPLRYKVWQFWVDIGNKWPICPETGILEYFILRVHHKNAKFQKKIIKADFKKVTQIRVQIRSKLPICPKKGIFWQKRYVSLFCTKDASLACQISKKSLDPFKGIRFQSFRPKLKLIAHLYLIRRVFKWIC